MWCSIIVEVRISADPLVDAYQMLIELRVHYDGSLPTFCDRLEDHMMGKLMRVAQ